jgi:hypothetical protein
MGAGPGAHAITASDDGTWAWGFYLFPTNGGTRLLSRNSIKTGPSLGAKIAMGLMSPGSWVMERKMLHGIKDRAENIHHEQAVSESLSASLY